MDRAEFEQIVGYLGLAERSKYSFADIKTRFESEPAAAYGENMARLIPDFEFAHQLLLDSLAVHLPTEARGVDLGAGNGRISLMLLDAFPGLQLSLVDISPNMLDAAKGRLAKYAPRCEYVVHDIFDAGLQFPGSSLDCVVSVFAVCHAQGIGVYEQLYARIHRWLKPGGIFACYDHVRGDTLSFTALNAMGWHRLLSASQTVEQAKDGVVGTYQEDSPLSLREHFGLLSAAGFSAFDVLYKRDIFAVYVGLK